VYASADTYTAIVTATNDVSTDSATTSVLIAEELDDPITGLVLTSDAPTVLGETTTFNATTTGGTNIIYEWNFGDGNSTTGSDSTVEHTYPEAGVYTATVTARNTASNVTASTQVEIVQEGAVTLYLPLIWQ
jgi:PKD repeat protein